MHWTASIPGDLNELESAHEMAGMAAGVAPTVRAGHVYFKPISSGSRGIFKREGEEEEDKKVRGRREEIVGGGRATIRWQNFLLIKEKKW